MWRVSAFESPPAELGGMGQSLAGLVTGLLGAGSALAGEADRHIRVPAAFTMVDAIRLTVAGVWRTGGAKPVDEGRRMFRVSTLTKCLCRAGSTMCIM